MDLDRRGGEMGAEEQIAEALRPAVQAAGLEIWDVERSGATVRVLVERPGGIDLDSISQLSSAISAALDQHDELVPAGKYMLEVSSPGLERRLRYPEHFARYIGQEVTVKTLEPVNETRRLRGTLTGASAEDITLRVDISPSETKEIRVPLESVQRAHANFTWGQTDKRARSKTASSKEAKAVREAPVEAAEEATW
jgi:ribosome maturation factor RimP